MPSYAADIEEDDRWAVVHYIRALQRSQNARDEDIP
jgi:mono/diheme cytochrome c family protein